MTYNEVFEGFKALSPADKQRLIEAAKSTLKWSNSNLRYGAKVQFKHSKTGAVIPGTFIKMKTKYAEVMSDFDQHGRKQMYPVRWSVSPEMLMPLPSEA